MGQIMRNQKVKLYPNKTMKKYLDDLCDYRRYCWNLGLETWNNMYEESLLMEDKTLRPNERKVRDELIYLKADWEYQFSSRCLGLTIKDLGNAWNNFFKKSQPDWGKPRFKSKKAPRQGFKTDRAKIINEKLRLDRPRYSNNKNNWYDIKFSGAKSLDGDLKMVSIYRENNQYYATLSFNVEIDFKKKTNQKTAVDLNVGHFNYTEGSINVCPKKLQFLYERIKHYQRVLARKRKVNGKFAYLSNNYKKTRAKLQRDYKKVANIQNNIIHKFTTQLTDNFDTIVIEDLDVKKMQMSHIASKGLHRSQFGRFRQYLTYKCEWYDKQLIVADRYYPSTQRCSCCGHIKTGDDKITLQGNVKHKTKHNEYICYECGFKADRDENAVLNLLSLVN